MANVTVSVPTSNITVDTTNSIVNVASTVSNVLVGETVIISNAEVRAAISVSNESGFGNLAYDNSLGSNGIIQYTGVSTSDIRGQLSATAPVQYNSTTGDISIDEAAIFSGKTTDDLAQGTTNIYFSQSGATVNTDALPEGSTNLYYTSARTDADIADYTGAITNLTGNLTTTANVNSASITTTANATIGANLNVLGNLEVTGNINYREVEDLLVQDQTITMNYGNASAQDAQIIVDRSGTGGGSNVDLKWNESTDRWQFTNDGSTYYDLPESTSDLAEGTNLYYTQGRFDTAFGNKTTDDLAQGTSNKYYANSLVFDYATSNGLFDINIQNNLNAENITARNTVFTDNVEPLTVPSQATDGANILISVPSGSPANTRISLRPAADPDTGNISGGVRLGAPDKRFKDTYSIRNITNDILTNIGETSIGLASLYSDTYAMGNIELDYRPANIEFKGYIENPSNPLPSPSFPLRGWVYGNPELKVNQLTKIVNPLGDTRYNAELVWDPLPGQTSGAFADGFPLWYGQSNISPIVDSIWGQDSYSFGEPNASWREGYIENVKSNRMFIGNPLPAGTDFTSLNGLGAEAAVIYGDSATSNPRLKLGYSNTNWGNLGEGTITTYGDIVDTQGDFTLNGTISFDGSSITGLTTDIVTEGTNLYYTTDRANSAISAYTGSMENLTGNISTTANITGGYIIAGNDAAEEGIFIGDINGAVQQEVRNDTGVTIAKGKAVYLTGVATGSTPEVALADNSNASKMPVIGIIKNQIPNTETGEIVTSGQLNIGAHGFTQGADLFVNGTGDLQETAPTGEGNLIQKIGKVVNSTTIIVQGAFRTNATPNLNEGNIFLGSTSNTAIAVTPDSNFDTTGNAFSLSNALTDVNTITSESASGLTFNSSDGTIVTSKFGVNSTVTETANIAGKGFGVFNYTNGLSTTISYSGTDVFEWYEIDGSVVSGSTTMTITSVVRGIDSTTAAVSDIIVGQIIANGTNLIIFPDDAYVVSVNSGAGTVEMSKPATQTTSFTYSTDGIILDAGLVDTSTGQVIKLLSDLRATGGGSTSSLAFRSFRNTPFGYPASGPEPTDFDIITTGTASDYSMTLSTFMLGQTPVTNDTTVLNAPLGITIGKNTQLTNRGENDSLSSFGMNMMWDGLTSYGRPIQPQVLFKSYTDNTEQGEVGSIGGAGPRLFFTSANGNSGDNAFDAYPRANQELGRLSFWGSTGTQLNPSSYNVPAYMSVQAADNWDTWGGGPAGNTNVYFASTASGQAQTYLAFKSGELYLTGSNSKPVTFAPAQSVSGFRPEEAYIGGDTRWADINYANTGTNAGAKFTVNNGGSVNAGTVGDMQMSLKRLDNSSNLTTDIESILDGTAIGISNQPFLMLDSALSPGNTLDGVLATMSASGTFTNSSTGNESALGGNQYYLNYVFTSGSTGNHGYRLSTGSPISSGGTIVTYTTLGGSSPVLSGGAANTVQTTPSTATTVVSSGVTAKEWKFNLAEQSNNLALQSEAVTKVEFSDTVTAFSNRVNFQNLDTTAINALSGMTSGDTVYNTTLNQLCFYNGSAWQKIDSQPM